MGSQTSTIQPDLPPIGYHYPFASRAKETGVRIRNGFNIQKSIDQTKGAILEVGGPTREGFYFLQGVILPRRPIITNLKHSAGMKDKNFRELYRPYIERKLDIRRNNLEDSSVGVCMASCLNIIAHEPRLSNEKAWDKKWKELAEEDKTLRKAPKIIPKIGLRYILLNHARKFLEDGGLLILEGLREQELKYALALGFSLRAATIPNNKSNSNVDTTYRSIVLQK